MSTLGSTKIERQLEYISLESFLFMGMKNKIVKKNRLNIKLYIIKLYSILDFSFAYDLKNEDDRPAHKKQCKTPISNQRNHCIIN